VNIRRSANCDAYEPPTHCRKGHAFNADNPPIIRPGSKAHCCRICRQAIVKKWNDITNGKKLKGWTREQQLAHMEKMRAARIYRKSA
jgi:hypothetical protein